MNTARELSFTITAAAAGDYAAGDVISASATDTAGVATEIAGASLRGLGLTILSARCICSEDDVRARLRLHFFDTAPLAAEVEMDDNAAYALTTAAGAAKWIGDVDLPAFADRGGVAVAENDLVRKVLFLSTTSLFVVVETLDAETNETAGMTLTFTLVVL